MMPQQRPAYFEITGPSSRASLRSTAEDFCDFRCLRRPSGSGYGGVESTAMDYPRDRGIHEVFEEQVRGRPEAVAVVFGGEKLTYRELDVRSGRLAGYLRMVGVGGGARVAISMEPSVEMIVGLLGILKVGAAYVPIDPHYPEERIGFMLRTARLGSC